MTVYEVHISREVGVEELPETQTIILAPGTAFALATRPGSLLLATDDHELALRAVRVHEASARRADDRHAWIKTVEMGD